MRRCFVGKVIEIKNPPKMWWPGDPRVENYMQPIRDALDRSGLKGRERTDVYNRAYEGIYRAIRYYEDNRIDRYSKGIGRARFISAGWKRLCRELKRRLDRQRKYVSEAADENQRLRFRLKVAMRKLDRLEAPND
jgi:hypothetical protein